jgi:hypothetical protein
MCEKKPGPRCSAETSSKLARKRVESDLAVSAYHADPTDETLLKMKQAKAARYLAQLQYDASPAGLVGLEEDSENNKLSRFLDTVELEVDGSPYEILLPANMAAKAKVTAATEYRSWQKSTAAALAKPNTEPKDLLTRKLINLKRGQMASASNLWAKSVWHDSILKAGGVSDYDGAAGVLAAKTAQDYLNMKISELESLRAEVEAANPTVLPYTPVPTKDLKAGDRIDQGTILRVQAGISTPSGKKEVIYRDQDGVNRKVLWGSGTLIRVLKPETE